MIVGGGLAGLASASVLSGLFDEVILLERDSISTQQASNPHCRAHTFLSSRKRLKLYTRAGP